MLGAAVFDGILFFLFRYHCFKQFYRCFGCGQDLDRSLTHLGFVFSFVFNTVVIIAVLVNKTFVVIHCTSPTRVYFLNE